MNHKKLSIIWFLFSLLTLSSLASDQWGGNLGFSYWHPDWTSEQTDFCSSTDGLYGPALFFHVKNWGLGIQYFTGSFDLDFQQSSQTLAANRTDMDIILSYRLAKYFQLSALYKNIEFDWKQTYKVKSTLSGFGFGGGFNNVFSKNFLCYGFGFAMPKLDYSQTIFSGSNLSGNADGCWVEGGLGYILSDLRLIVKLGYRYQRLSFEADTHDWIEKTEGLRVDLSYYF